MIPTRTSWNVTHPLATDTWSHRMIPRHDSFTVGDAVHVLSRSVVKPNENPHE
jgi:hypothetical protein